jgi:hypothetical protein
LAFFDKFAASCDIEKKENQEETGYVEVDHVARFPFSGRRLPPAIDLGPPSLQSAPME